MALNLNFGKTFEESRKIYEAVLTNDAIGIPVRIQKDNTKITKTLAKSFEQTALRVQNEVLQHCLQATFLLTVDINQGDYIEIYDSGVTITDSSVPVQRGIVLSTVTQDPVSKVCSLLEFNVVINRIRRNETFDKYGNRVTSNPNILTFPVYLERSTYRKVDYGVGQAREITATLYAYKDEDIKISDVIEYQGDRYRVDNINDLKTDYMLICDLSNYME